MRIKNKEIRRRRHRKEQTIKAAERVIRSKFGEAKPTPAAPKKPASKKAGADTAKKAAAKPKKAEA